MFSLYFSKNNFSYFLRAKESLGGSPKDLSKNVFIFLSE